MIIKSKFFTKDFYYSQLGISPVNGPAQLRLGLHDSKGTSHTSVPNSTYEVQKIKIQASCCLNLEIVLVLLISKNKT
jgi:hypothetical protein